MNRLTVRRPVARDVTGGHGSRDPDHALIGTVLAAVRAVPGADAGGISMTTGDGKVSSCSPTTTAVAALDQVQSDWCEGPCISALDEPSADGVIVADDLDGHDGQRWPGFAPYALDAGYHSILSVELNTDAGVCAALNLYAGRPHVFDVSARMAAAAFGARAALLIDGARRVGDAASMPSDGEVIAQATGILMGRFSVDDRAAFEVVARCAQEAGSTLGDVARWLRADAPERRRTRREPAITTYDDQ